MTKEQAIDFFSELYGGEHHIPGKGVKEWGSGWRVHHYGDLSTYDYSLLTKFVLMCHDRCVRGSIIPNAFKDIKLCIWQRTREGGLSQSHPTIEQAIEKFRK